MRDIFSDLYNKVLSFFVSQNVHDETKSVAKSRLRTVLMQDRVGFSERAMQMLKEELVSTISKYMEIDEERFDLEINALDDATTLNLAIPVLRAKTDDEIDEAVKEQAIKTQAKAQEIVEELEELIKERAAVLAGVQDGEVLQDDSKESDTSDDNEQDEHDEASDDDNDEDEESFEEHIEERDDKDVQPSKKHKKAKVKEN